MKQIIPILTFLSLIFTISVSENIKNATLTNIGIVVTVLLSVRMIIYLLEKPKKDIDFKVFADTEYFRLHDVILIAQKAKDCESYPAWDAIYEKRRCDLASFLELISKREAMRIAKKSNHGGIVEIVANRPDMKKRDLRKLEPFEEDTFRSYIR